MTAAPGEIDAFPANLRIRKNDFIAVQSEDFGASTFGLSDGSAGARSKIFYPGIEDGSSAFPTESGPSVRLFLYNARLVR